MRRRCRRRRSPVRRSCGSRLQARCRPSVSCRLPRPSRRAGIRTSSRTQRRRTRRSPWSRSLCPRGRPRSRCRERTHRSSRRGRRGWRRRCRRRRSRVRQSCGSHLRDPSKPWATRTRPKLRMSRHSNVEPDSEEANETLAAVAVVVPDGPAEIEVSGADASIVQAREAGDASTLPAASLARTSKLWEPPGEPGVGLRRATSPPSRAVQPAFERRAGLRRRERDARGSRRGRARGTGRDRRVGSGRIDRPGAGGRGRVDVAGGVDRAYVKAVGATGETRISLGRRARGPSSRIEPALE